MIFLFVVAFCFGVPNRSAWASGELEIFATTAAYGALAGAVVGGASTVFYSDQGGDLQTIAKGASLGLYAGMLIGGFHYYNRHYSRSYRVDLLPSITPSGEVDGALAGLSFSF